MGDANKLRRWPLLIGVVMAAPALLGAEPNLTSDHLKSRFYQITENGGSLTGLSGAKVCMGGDQLEQMTGHEGPSDGCIHNSPKSTDGSVALEIMCTWKSGAGTTTNHLTVSGTLLDFLEHLDVTTVGPDNEAKIDRSDTHMVYLGDCPAQMKPGQFVQPDGKVNDVVAAALAAAKGASK